MPNTEYIVREQKFEIGTKLSKYHQKESIFEYEIKNPTFEWANGLYFYWSDKPFEGYGDDSHPHSITIELVKPLTCIICDSELNVSGNEVPSELLKKFEEIVGQE